MCTDPGNRTVVDCPDSELLLVCCWEVHPNMLSCHEHCYIVYFAFRHNPSAFASRLTSGLYFLWLLSPGENRKRLSPAGSGGELHFEFLSQIVPRGWWWFLRTHSFWKTAAQICSIIKPPPSKVIICFMHPVPGKPSPTKQQHQSLGRQYF